MEKSNNKNQTFNFHIPKTFKDYPKSPSSIYPKKIIEFKNSQSPVFKDSTVKKELNSPVKKELNSPVKSEFHEKFNDNLEEQLQLIQKSLCKVKNSFNLEQLENIENKPLLFKNKN